MQNCPRQLAMQSCVLCSFVRTSKQIEKTNKKNTKKLSNNKNKWSYPSGMSNMVKRRWNNVVSTSVTSIQCCLNVVWPWCAHWVANTKLFSNKFLFLHSIYIFELTQLRQQEQYQKTTPATAQLFDWKIYILQFYQFLFFI